MKHKLIIVFLVAAILLIGRSVIKGKDAHICKLMPVADRQRWLNKAGFPCKVDGICGAETHASQLAWEKQEIGIDADYWYILFGGTE